MKMAVLAGHVDLASQLGQGPHRKAGHRMAPMGNESERAIGLVAAHGRRA